MKSDCEELTRLINKAEIKLSILKERDYMKKISDTEVDWKRNALVNELYLETCRLKRYLEVT